MPVFVPQAAYRGLVGRTEYRRLLAEREEARRRQAEREAAALAVIAPWAATFRDRAWFLRARRAAPVLQAWWRRKFARRAAAATAIQAAVRCYLARQQLQRSREAALKIQVRAVHASGVHRADLLLLQRHDSHQWPNVVAHPPPCTLRCVSLTADHLARLPRAGDAPAPQAAG